MVKIKEAIVVEGRYDKNTLSQILDAPILETSGFGIFKDKQRLSMLRRIAETRGLIVFTDSDGAGFVIRNHIKKSDIDAVTEPVLDAVVFQMTELLSAGRYADALLKLQQLLKMQEEPIKILGAVGGHFRRISTARTLLDNGRNASDLQKLCAPMPDFAARKTMEAARRFTPNFCRKAAELVVETDYRMKTSFDDNERLLELLILQLSQEALHG